MTQHLRTYTDDAARRLLSRLLDEVEVEDPEVREAIRCAIVRALIEGVRVGAVEVQALALEAGVEIVIDWDTLGPAHEPA